MNCTSHPVARLAGIVRAPGDKSCSHRALILAGLADGVSEITGLLEGDDVLRTGAAMASLGATVDQTGPGEWTVAGVGAKGLSVPSRALDFGNSGTGSRLIMGAAAGAAIEVEFTGDESLRSRPMNRILTPLRQMGARDDAAEHGRLPLRLLAHDGLRAIDYTPPVASAQVKSAVLLAGLSAEGTTRIMEPKLTRDHSERMLVGFGADVGRSLAPGGGQTVSIQGGQTLTGIKAAIPGDPSSAAFLAAAAAISPKASVLIEGVMSNSTRDGFFDVLSRMGVQIGAEDVGDAVGERLIDVQVSSASRLNGIDVPEALVPSMIDEFPILAVVAAFASGTTRVTGAEELRVKESDRIDAVIAMLRANGVACKSRPDGFEVEGCGGPPPGGGVVETLHDHRIAMSALVMGTAAQKPVSVDDVSMIATSYPDFMDHMAALGANISA
ncbi:MAG: 3-phosphoshikimate 1-carboxyvinyltransferase [Pseudomonadota bacterium]